MHFKLKKGKFAGSTTIGSIRCSVWKSLTTLSNVFDSLPGIDLYYKNKLIENDNTELLDINGLWHGSQLVCKPVKFAYCFIFAAHNKKTKQKYNLIFKIN